MAKRLDLVIWGATGFTGRLCAVYMAQKYGLGGQVSWAVAGRSREKLERLREELATHDSAMHDLRLIVADSGDKLSLKDMCEQAKVVVATVGPYIVAGYNLVEACIESGTHYCDLTGEVPFIKNLVDHYHAKAIHHAVKIVNCCGFDCIPVDLGTFMVCEYMRQHNVEIKQVHAVAGKMKGSMSGGTIASGMEIVGRSSWKQLMEMGNPHVLLGNIPRPPYYNTAAGIKYSHRLLTWTMPYFMAGIDIPIVHRSNALMNFRYGKELKYYESMAAPNVMFAIFGYLAINLLGVLTLFPPFRWFLKSMVPQGTGPSEELQRTGYMNMHILGDGKSNGSRVAVKGLVAAHGADPGYALTAQMLCESALCLVFDASKLPARFGVLTPASAMGETLIQRLKDNVGMKFEVSEV